MSKIKMQALAKVVAKAHGIRAEEITNATKKRYAVYPRFVFYWIARHELGYSTSQIGRFAGGRDHTTIVHGTRQADLLGLIDPDDVSVILEQAKTENEIQLNKWRV